MRTASTPKTRSSATTSWATTLRLAELMFSGKLSPTKHRRDHHRRRAIGLRRRDGAASSRPLAAAPTPASRKLPGGNWLRDTPPDKAMWLTRLRPPEAWRDLGTGGGRSECGLAIRSRGVPRRGRLRGTTPRVPGSTSPGPLGGARRIVAARRVRRFVGRIDGGGRRALADRLRESGEPPARARRGAQG